MFNSVSLTLYFNSRPHGGRHSHGAGIGSSFCISTHALTEGDSFQKPPEALKRSFQLTPSRRATTVPLLSRLPEDISTHALTEGDWLRLLPVLLQCISTHALTEGDHTFRHNHDPNQISTHALTEGDKL